MERETRTLVLPVSKSEVVIKSWITGREKRGLEKGYDEVKKKSPEMDTTTANEFFDAWIDLVVISINGSAERKIETLLDLPEEDNAFIGKIVREIVSPGKTDEEKKS